jgi:hypothetical protein
MRSRLSERNAAAFQNHSGCREPNPYRTHLGDQTATLLETCQLADMSLSSDRLPVRAIQEGTIGI